MIQTHKQIYIKTMRKKWAFKKHTHASINQVYEVRGRTRRKIKVFIGDNTNKSAALAQYKASKRIAKRVTNGYSRRQISG